MELLESEFYRQHDTLAIAKALLGKVLHTQDADGHITQARITETEAYCGIEDRACHAYRGRNTQRTWPMYEAGGIAYVYICYGVHHLFNIVTHGHGEPHAVLARAAEPLQGETMMLKRRGLNKLDSRTLCGPGVLAQALGISTEWNAANLQTGPIRIYRDGVDVEAAAIATSARVGVGGAGPDANNPYRFYLKGSKWVSRPLAPVYA